MCVCVRVCTEKRAALESALQATLASLRVKASDLNTALDSAANKGPAKGYVTCTVSESLVFWTLHAGSGRLGGRSMQGATHRAWLASIVRAMNHMSV